MPWSGRVAPRNSRWPESSYGGWNRECWCSPTAVSTDSRLWSQAAGTGADLLWRVKTTLRPRHGATLPDGSWLARIVATSGVNRASTPPLNVRVIDYTIDDGGDNPEQYRLLTTILHPDQASATELASAYAQRWEIESVFDELKSHQHGPRAVLRSHPPSWCSRRPGGTCTATTPSARSCSTPPHTPGMTPIEYPSLRRYVSPEERYPTTLFPLTTMTLSAPSGSAPSENSPNASIQHAAPGPTHGGQTQSPQMGSQTHPAHAMAATGPQPTDHYPTSLLNGIEAKSRLRRARDRQPTVTTDLVNKSGASLRRTTA